MISRTFGKLFGGKLVVGGGVRVSGVAGAGKVVRGFSVDEYNRRKD